MLWVQWVLCEKVIGNTAGFFFFVRNCQIGGGNVCKRIESMRKPMKHTCTHPQNNSVLYACVRMSAFLACEGLENEMSLPAVTCVRRVLCVCLRVF